MLDGEVLVTFPRPRRGCLACARPRPGGVLRAGRQPVATRTQAPRLGPDDDPSAVLAADVVDAAAPVAWSAAGSEAVALVREAAAAGEGWWTPDEAEPEASFAALVTAAAAGKGSDWLEWESHDGAGSVRADPVVMLTAHRHFPVGDDAPWVHAAVGGGRLVAVPLRFVVSYRPDPQVRERWERMLSDLLP